MSMRVGCALDCWTIDAGSKVQLMTYDGTLFNFLAIPTYSSSQFPINPRFALTKEHGTFQLAQIQEQSSYSPLCTQ